MKSRGKTRKTKLSKLKNQRVRVNKRKTKSKRKSRKQRRHCGGNPPTTPTQRPSTSIPETPRTDQGRRRTSTLRPISLFGPVRQQTPSSPTTVAGFNS